MKKYYFLGSVSVIFTICSRHCRRHVGSTQVRIFLTSDVHSYIRIVFHQNDGVNQQNNVNAARNVGAWFKEKLDEFTNLQWSANSQDLNPIENLWDNIDWLFAPWILRGSGHDTGVGISQQSGEQHQEHN